MSEDSRRTALGQKHTLVTYSKGWFSMSHGLHSPTTFVSHSTASGGTAAGPRDFLIATPGSVLTATFRFSKGATHRPSHVALKQYTFPMGSKLGRRACYSCNPVSVIIRRRDSCSRLARRRASQTTVCFSSHLVKKFGTDFNQGFDVDIARIVWIPIIQTRLSAILSRRKKVDDCIGQWTTLRV